jgi:hypothetical protein
MQAPPPQVSPVVQALPSSQATVFGTNVQAPVWTLQPLVVQTLLSSHVFGVPGVQPPLASQVSPSVQALLSLQLVPASRFGFVHCATFS